MSAKTYGAGGDYPTSRHQNYGAWALIYRDTESPVLKNLIRKVTRFSQPWATDPDGMCVAQDSVSRQPYPAQPWSPRHGPRFGFVVASPADDSDDSPDDSPDDDLPGVDTEGVRLSLQHLNDYARRAALGAYSVSDAAVHTPQVALRLRLSGTCTRLQDMLTRLLCAHVRGTLTVAACRPTPAAPFSRLARTVQRNVALAVGRRGVPAKLMSLFSPVCRGGKRALYEQVLRRRVLLFAVLCDPRASRQKKLDALDSVGEQHVQRLWDTHASTHKACLEYVFSRAHTGDHAAHAAAHTAAPAAAPGARATQQTLLHLRKRRRTAGGRRARAAVPDQANWYSLDPRVRRTHARTALALHVDWNAHAPKYKPHLEKFNWVSRENITGVKRLPWRALHTPQVLVCKDADDDWRAALRPVTHDHLPGARCLVTNTLPLDWALWDGVVCCGDGGIVHAGTQRWLCLTDPPDPANACTLDGEPPYLLVHATRVPERVHVWCPSPHDLQYTYVYAQLLLLMDSAEVPEEPLPAAVVDALKLRRAHYAGMVEEHDESLKQCARGDEHYDRQQRREARRGLEDCTRLLEETEALFAFPVRHV